MQNCFERAGIFRCVRRTDTYERPCRIFPTPEIPLPETIPGLKNKPVLFSTNLEIIGVNTRSNIVAFALVLLRSLPFFPEGESNSKIAFI